MNESRIAVLNGDDTTNSQSSDEKMDTGSESYRSQGTPNSVLSDFDDRETDSTEVLRLQNPEITVSNFKSDLNNSLISKMSNLRLDSPKIDLKNQNIGISPPKVSATLTLTTDHPLMGLNSPDENFPDVVPKKSHKGDEDKEFNISSVDEEQPVENGYNLYSPQTNTSKNNLYFTENFITADSQMLNESKLDNTPPDIVARVERKCMSRFMETNIKEVASSTPQRDMGKDEERGAVLKHFEERTKKLCWSTPKSNIMDISEREFHSGVADWCESPSQLRSMPNFDLPIELSSTTHLNHDLDSPDVVSSSTQEDKSAYEALLDPYTGSVALRPTVKPRSPSTQRRKILLPPEVEEDRCSLDSISNCSLDSEDVQDPVQPDLVVPDDEGSGRSKSSNTMSECSDPIPEYSAADEFRDERSWVTVERPEGNVKCDMKVIEPYKRVLSHGGYSACGAAIIVFSACHLPDNGRVDYTYVMDNLFLYVIWSLERLVTDEYILIYLHGSAGRRRLPGLQWLRACYRLVDRRLRKSLKHLYLVHPTFWLKSFVILTKPFVSSKFFKKLSYVRSLNELSDKVTVEPNAIPELVKIYDAQKR